MDSSPCLTFPNSTTAVPPIRRRVLRHCSRGSSLLTHIARAPVHPFPAFFRLDQYPRIVSGTQLLGPWFVEIAMLVSRLMVAVLTLSTTWPSTLQAASQQPRYPLLLVRASEPGPSGHDPANHDHPCNLVVPGALRSVLRIMWERSTDLPATVRPNQCRVPSDRATSHRDVADAVTGTGGESYRPRPGGDACRARLPGESILRRRTSSS